VRPIFHDGATPIAEARGSRLSQVQGYHNRLLLATIQIPAPSQPQGAWWAEWIFALHVEWTFQPNLFGVEVCTPRLCRVGGSRIPPLQENRL